MTHLEQLFDGKLPRLVMFDLDGTLMDSVPDLAAATDKMLMLLGREPAGVTQVRDWVGNGSRCWCVAPWPVSCSTMASLMIWPTRRWRCSCRPIPGDMS